MNKVKIPASVERNKTGDYIINFTKRSKYEVFKGLSENEIEKTNSFISDGEDIIVKSDFSSPRYVFLVKDISEEKSFFISEKHLPMQGTPNFRDLGGILNKSGKQIKWGYFFRSGSLNDFTQSDWNYFKTLGIKRVIDLRSEYEANVRPDIFPDGLTIDYIHSPIGNPVDFKKLLEYGADKFDAEKISDLIISKGSKALMESIGQFAPIFDAMKKEEPFLFHCSAGKDRTGMVSALILSVLDVGREEIIEDYLLSNKYTIPFFTENISIITDMGIPKEAALETAGVKKEFLEMVFGTVIKKYGSFDNMIAEEFGINENIKQDFIKKYTV